MTPREMAIAEFAFAIVTAMAGLKLRTISAIGASRGELPACQPISLESQGGCQQDGTIGPTGVERQGGNPTAERILRIQESPPHALQRTCFEPAHKGIEGAHQDKGAQNDNKDGHQLAKHPKCDPCENKGNDTLRRYFKSYRAGHPFGLLQVVRRVLYSAVSELSTPRLSLPRRPVRGFRRGRASCRQRATYTGFSLADQETPES